MENYNNSSFIFLSIINITIINITIINITIYYLFFLIFSYFC